MTAIVTSTWLNLLSISLWSGLGCFGRDAGDSRFLCRIDDGTLLWWWSLSAILLSVLPISNQQGNNLISRQISVKLLQLETRVGCYTFSHQDTRHCKWDNTFLSHNTWIFRWLEWIQQVKSCVSSELSFWKIKKSQGFVWKRQSQSPLVLKDGQIGL